MKSAILFVFMILSLVVGVSAYDMTKNVSINESDLPTSDSINFPFQLLEGETLYFDVTNLNGEISLDYVENYTLNETDEYNWVLEYDFDRTIIFENESYLVEINVSNSLNSNVYEIGLYYYLIDQKESVYNISSIDTLEIIDGKYHKNVSLFDLGGNGTFEFNVVGQPGEIYKLTGCDDDRFLSCQNSSFSLDSEGKYRLKIPYDLPFTPLGKYNESFHLNSSLKDYDVEIVFNIVQPDIFTKPANINPICFQDEDNLTIRQRLDCETEIAEYRFNAIIELNNYASKIQTENICEQFVKTEYVVGESISKEVLDKNLQLVDQNADFRIENKDLSDSLSSCRDKNSQLKNLFNATITEKDQKMKNITLSTEAEINNIREAERERRFQEVDNVTGNLKIISFFIIAVCLILGMVKSMYYTKTMHEIKWIDYKVLATTIFLSLLQLISLWVWG